MHEVATRKLIIGVGNPLCGDDGAGHAVIEHLRDLRPADVELLALSGEATRLIDAWSGADWVAIVDASQSDAAPATIRRFDVAAGDVPAAPERASSHGFGVAEAVALARNLDRLPGRLFVYAIEGERFEPGAPVSAEVAESAAALARELAGAVSVAGYA